MLWYVEVTVMAVRIYANTPPEGRCWRYKTRGSKELLKDRRDHIVFLRRDYKIYLSSFFTLVGLQIPGYNVRSSQIRLRILACPGSTNQLLPQ